MADFLATMAAGSLRRLEAARTARSMDRLMRLVEDSSPAPRLALAGGFDVIAEIKATSPAEGALADVADFDPTARATAYATGGAAAVSVLTEPDRFSGALEHLAAAARVLASHDVPAMRKDFLVDDYQVVEARLAGAGGVLAIVAMLEDAVLANLTARAIELGLFVLVECFDAEDAARASRLVDTRPGTELAEAGQLLVGVNTRDLRTLAVDNERLERLVDHLPRELPRVAESGLKAPADAARAVGMGYDVALIGTALMRRDDATQAVIEFVEAGRAASGGHA
ncbi:MAG: indole-3-glycerol phosphate synthase TrpC [Pseudomonadota bacterium]